MISRKNHKQISLLSTRVIRLEHTEGRTQTDKEHFALSIEKCKTKILLLKSGVELSVKHSHRPLPTWNKYQEPII